MREHRSLRGFAGLHNASAFLAGLAALTGCQGTNAPDDRSEAARQAATTVTADTGTYAPKGTPVELGVAGYVKVLCSALFVSGRELEEAARNSGFFFLNPEDRDGVTAIEVDETDKSVRMTWGDTLTRSARYYGDQGCTLHPRGLDTIFYEPVPVRSALPAAETLPWPMGDRPSDRPLPADVDADGLQAAAAAAFADPEGLTAAFVVVHRGRIVMERYAPGIDKDTQLESWSMGKSLTAALVGRLIQDGHFELDDPAPVAAWQGEDDPRRAIRIADLLHMSSGLRFIAPRDPDYTPDKGYPDHMYIYSGAVDAFEYSYSRPLQFEPNTEGRYRNSDPLTLGYIVQQTVRGLGQEYLTYPQRELFDRIGIRRQVLETDPYGNFLLTGFDYGTARNWARLGMLYLQDGVWEGKRLLPEGFVDFVSSPAPAWKQPVYGGLFWLNGDGAWNLPASAYFMAGGGGQRTFVIPTHDLVVVRLGHFRGSGPGMAALNAALSELMQAVPRN